MSILTVVNIKCGGCEQMIISSLEKEGLTNIKVDVANQTVSFDGDIEKAKNILAKLGYPEADSKEAKSFFKKAKSYTSCLIGRIKK